MYANVIIEYGVKKLNQTFTYIIPEKFIGVLKKGMKVYVPFGSQKIFGFVLDVFDNIEDPSFKLKSIIDIVDPYLVLSDELLDVGKYLSNETLCSLITSYQTMLPSSLKVGERKHNYALFDEFVSLKDIKMAKQGYLQK